MASVKVLVEGYARQKTEWFEASSSTVLVEDNGKKIIVDPGCNEALLLGALKKHKISPQEIDYIFLTHNHIDHFINMRLFPGKSIVDGGTVYSGDRENSFSNFLPGTNIEFVFVPGHAAEHTALLVKTDKGVVAVAGDVFWWMDKKQKTDLKSLLKVDDPFASSESQLLASREALLSKADLIIPGHGKMFKVPKKELFLWNVSKNRI